MADERPEEAEADDPASVASAVEAKVFEFDLATAVLPTARGFSATVDPGWTIGTRPNGGYLLALATRAALMVTGQPHPLAVSGHFLAPPSIGPADLEARPLRSGRSVSSARVTLLQEGQPCLEALVSAGRLEPRAEPEWRADGGPPRLPPLQECVPGQANFAGVHAAGWLRCAARGRLLQGGWFDEEVEVWDQRDRLVAQSRQLAAVRR